MIGDRPTYLKVVTTPTSTGSVTVITYKQNALNQRIAKLVDGEVVEKYLWRDLTTLLAIYDKDNNLVQRFEYADARMPVAMTDVNGTKYYLHYDQVGSLRAVSDINGNVVKEITYDTYGNIINDTNPSFKVPFGFAGGLYDADTKLTRFGYRDYDAYTGKWTAKDPIGFAGGDSNLYGYVLGDPVGFVDPLGLWIDLIFPESLGEGSDRFPRLQNMRWDPKTGKLTPLDPETGKPVEPNLRCETRQPDNPKVNNPAPATRTPKTLKQKIIVAIEAIIRALGGWGGRH